MIRSLMSDNPELDFKDVAERYYAPLYRFGYSLAKNEHEASDLTQQTFLIFAEKGQTLRDPAKVKSWLFTTLYREFLRTRRRGSTIASYEPELLEVEAPVVEPDMARALDGNQAVEALEYVDEIYRAPLALFYIEDLSYREIAEILDIPIGTVMSRLSRGKSHLKKALLSQQKSNV